VFAGVRWRCSNTPLEAALETRPNYSAKLPYIAKPKQVLSFDLCKLLLMKPWQTSLKENTQQKGEKEQARIVISSNGGRGCTFGSTGSEQRQSHCEDLGQ